jgi:hypothetical protein
LDFFIEKRQFWLIIFMEVLFYINSFKNLYLHSRNNIYWRKHASLCSIEKYLDQWWEISFSYLQSDVIKYSLLKSEDKCFNLLLFFYLSLKKDLIFTYQRAQTFLSNLRLISSIKRRLLLSHQYQSFCEKCQSKKLE